MRIFLAGGTGAIGRRLVPQLVADGHQVTATTRTPTKLDLLRGLGAEAVVLDGLDERAVGEAVGRADPEVVIHQMTAIPDLSNVRRFDQLFEPTNALRTAGLDHLLAAAIGSGARRILVQSYTGWPNQRKPAGMTTATAAATSTAATPVSTTTHRDSRDLATEDEPLDPSPPFGAAAEPARHPSS